MNKLKALEKRPMEGWRDFGQREQEAFIDRVEELGHAILEGRDITRRQVIYKFAVKWGCSTREVRSILLSDQARPYLAKMTACRALIGTMENLPAQIAAGKDDIQAFRTVAQIAELLQSGVQVQTNVQVDQRNLGNNESDRGFFLRMQERMMDQVRQRMELADGDMRDPEPDEDPEEPLPEEPPDPDQKNGEEPEPDIGAEN
jgi:hypothetical protein